MAFPIAVIVAGKAMVFVLLMYRLAVYQAAYNGYPVVA